MAGLCLYAMFLLRLLSDYHEIVQGGVCKIENSICGQNDLGSFSSLKIALA